jgi:AcrR family transcriptional regulator
MPYRRTPAVEQRQAQVRARLVSEAAALVAGGGWAACSITTVAARAGVATGTVYGYFASKADLLAEVFRTVSSREIAAALDVAQQVREDTDACACACACEVILAIVGVFAERAAQAPRLAYAVLAEPVDVAVDVERLAFRRAWTDLLAVAVREGVERGQLPYQDPQVTAGALLGAVAEVLVQPLAAGAVDAAAYGAVVQSLLSFTRRCLGGNHDHHA